MKASNAGKRGVDHTVALLSEHFAGNLSVSEPEAVRDPRRSIYGYLNVSGIWE
ncbi:hypothetical protein [Pseudomonas mosselii]|uniref:hypothetical protein n=1 Tax=Pseudomonas mosselii TaxID=78327 RepID=UPI0021D98190|nr:hypothetical protein [Pseudomonas mosselii]MCU9529547.1 hypothetical protein [Pseudomonas mosselii]MCU9536847.1 hypothetical protein [Pseudomonas mosselii]MCU9543170.1 hypothetical protein [Pseudomonas mosselii]MCU9548450.1 hypothetical protein [Pseudomonas mosselii]